MTDQELVDCLGFTWASILELGASLSDSDWEQPSLLPGWSVQDVVAHMLATEELLLGRPAPDHQAPTAEHVRNPLGAFVENGVDVHRGRPGYEVLADFAEVADLRIEALRALDDAGFGAPVAFPLGDGTVRGVLPFRIVDCWVHEQDIRVALDRPGGWESPATILVFDLLFAGMGKAVAKQAGAPDGAVVVFRVGGANYAVEVRDGRGRPVDETSAPSVVLVMDPETFWMLACGRGDPAALAEDVMVEGDTVLGARVLANMNTMI